MKNRTNRRRGDESRAREILQRPPAYSAVKVGGERAYRRARRGEVIEMPPRQVTVHRFVQLHREGDRAEYEAAQKAKDYAAKGDSETAEQWRQVREAIRVLRGPNAS